ncbi:MAG: DMT family transporter [Thermoplasmata archaeon]
MSDDTPPAPSYVGVGLLLVLMTAVISGISTFVNAYAVHGTSSDAFVTVRNLAVAGMILPLAVLARRTFTRSLRGVDWARLVAIGFIGGAVPFLLFFHGLALATAAGGGLTASFLYRTLFLMATVFGVVYLRERFHPRVAIAAGLLLGGNYLLLSLSAPVWTDGTLYVVAATVLWAVEYTISKQTLRDLPSGIVAMGRMGIGAAFLVGYLALTSQLGAVGALNGGQWTWVLISAVLLAAFVGTWYAGLRRVDVGVATSVLVLGFPVTWILSILVRGSSFTLLQAAGAAAVVGGVAVVVGLTMLRQTWTAVAERVRTGLGLAA